MYNPVRGGTRGGQGDFKWSDVASDKDRENYLGHSVNAPVGRWQNGKDLTWYNKDGKEPTEGEKEEKRREEIRAIKEAEEDALAVALGFAPVVRPPRPPPGSTSQDQGDSNESVLARAAAKAAEKEAHRKEKEERRKERAAKREEREKKRGGEKEKERRRSRSRSPARREGGERERERRGGSAREDRQPYEDRERRRGEYDSGERRGGGGDERRRDQERYRPREEDRDSRRRDGYGGKERSRSPAGRRY